VRRLSHSFLDTEGSHFCLLLGGCVTAPRALSQKRRERTPLPAMPHATPLALRVPLGGEAISAGTSAECPKYASSHVLPRSAPSPQGPLREAQRNGSEVCIWQSR